MTPPSILVTQPTLADVGKKLLAEVGARVSYLHHPPVTEDELCEIVTRDDTTAIILRGSPPVTRRVIDAARHLRIISKHGAGIDSVDLEAANERGIPVVVASGVNADAVAEHALGMMLALARDLNFHDANLKRGIWDKASYLGREFSGHVIGIVGLGAIGKRVGQLARAFGCKVIATSRSRPAELGGIEWVESLEALLRAADIVSLHCPLTDKTRAMINERTLALMKPDAILINTGRGKLVDERALYAALTNGRLRAAGLDTFAQEPVDRNDPLPRLANVMSSPHIAPNTRETLVRLAQVAVGQVLDYLRDGKIVPSNLVNQPFGGTSARRA